MFEGRHPIILEVFLILMYIFEILNKFFLLLFKRKVKNGSLKKIWFALLWTKILRKKNVIFY